MSRVLVSALALSVFSVSPSVAQPLNINPFPVNKAGTLSAKDPELLKEEPVEKFAEEAEGEILKLERENAELMERVQQEEAAQAAQKAKEAEERARIEAEEKALKAAVLKAQEEEARRLEAQNKALERELAQKQAEENARREKAERIAAEMEARKQAELRAQEEEARRLKAENEALEKELAAKKAQELAQKQEEERLAAEAKALAQQKVNEEIAALERENAKLLSDLNEEKKALKIDIAPLEKETVIFNEEGAGSQAEVDYLRKQNEALQADIVAMREENQKQQALQRELAVLEAQKKQAKAEAAKLKAEQFSEQLIDEEVAQPAIDPLFESAALQEDSVDMTPMPEEVLEVRASDLGLVQPTVSPLQADDKMAEPAVPSQALLDEPLPVLEAETKPKLEVMPFPPKLAVTRPQVNSRPRIVNSYRTARAGESLEGVLSSWAKTEGVGFLWKTTRPYQVISSVSGGDDFAASIEALLSQYEGQSVRPIAKLHTDRVTGTRTLTIMSE